METPWFCLHTVGAGGSGASSSSVKDELETAMQMSLNQHLTSVPNPSTQGLYFVKRRGVIDINLGRREKRTIMLFFLTF